MLHSRLFTVYFALDFSARSRPTSQRKRPDALWLAELMVDEEEGRTLFREEDYFPTRYQLYTHLEARLSHHLAQGQRIFLGVDFALGYPQGFAKALGFGGKSAPAWRAIWELFSVMIQEQPDNRNNRFAVAANLNARMNGQLPGPFWGTPLSHQSTYLRRYAPPFPFDVGAGVTLPRLRLTEQHARSAQETWKLFGIGSVGGQTLLGIPFVHRLATHSTLAAHTDIFPFTWHYTPSTLTPRSLVIAEIYPTLTKLPLEPDLIKDQSQVRNTAHYFATLDGVGGFADFFAPPSYLSLAEWNRCIEEEGWIVGLPQQKEVH